MERTKVVTLRRALRRSSLDCDAYVVLGTSILLVLKMYMRCRALYYSIRVINF